MVVDDRNRALAVEHAAKILCQFTPDEPSFGVRELARRLDIGKTTVQRILISLCRVEFLTYDPDSERYSVGPGLIKMARPFMRSDDLVEAALGAMEVLRDAFNETVTLSVAIARSRVTILQVTGHHEVRYQTEIGRQYPLLSGSTGRVLLAYLPREELGPTLDFLLSDEGGVDGALHWERHTLLAELASVRERGYARSRGEWTPSGAGISVPILKDGRFVAALSVYAPDSRLDDERANEILPALKAAARDIGDRARPTPHDGGPSAL